ncbi:GNAT family N-acetyltransferase [Streptomyces tsukubensis]|nr:GNAT family N-acetyltransferase [Streptomyces tsukubensis]QFR93498.1 GNAT family N-acetyltransferase [Streptomyces tsukubensis]
MAHGDPSLTALESYYDSAPRSAARAEAFGPLTFFVREAARGGAGFPFYARPAHGWTGRPANALDVVRVRARQRELGLPEAFEWVEETTPHLRAAVEDAGLVTHAHPLMVLDPGAVLPDPHPLVRLVDADDPALPGALAVPYVAFAAPGTSVGAAGAEELAARVLAQADDGTVPAAAERIRAGMTGLAAAVEGGGVLSSGRHNPVGDVSEIVAVGTLPAARRRGLGLAVTAALVADARARGVATVFLSADDDQVARVYARLGFVTVGTAMIAEPAP